MLTLWQRHRVMRAIESSDLVQVGDMHLLVMPVDNDVLEYLGMWGAETVDDEEGGDLEEQCEDEGAQCEDEGWDCEDEGAEVDDQGAPGFLAVPPEMKRKALARGRRYLDVKVEL